MSSETYAINDLKTRELEVPVATATEALGPDNGVRLRVDELSAYYGKVQAVKQVTLVDQNTQGHGAHRTLGLWQIDVYPLSEPDARADSGSASGRQGPAG
jgi:hypothetical protein